MIKRIVAASERSWPGNLLPWLSYRVRYLARRNTECLEGFSVVIATRNRRAFLSQAMKALMENTTMPFEVIVMDNASQDGTSEDCEKLAASFPGKVIHVRLDRNYGTNAYALGFLRARYRFLVDMDDDVLALSRGWDMAVARAFRDIPKLGFLALNVVQDNFTNGAKPAPSAYREVACGSTVIEVGPTGGWFAVTPREVYLRVGGFIFRPEKPFQGEDGDYAHQMRRHGLVAGILRHKYVYHATGPYWNKAYGYGSCWREKYERDHKHLVGALSSIRRAVTPSMDYAQAMLEAVESGAITDRILNYS